MGVDGSDFSTAALKLAGRMAKGLGAPLEIVTRSVKFGPPAKLLVEESRDAQLLVVGRRGRGGFLAQIMGSVSGACVAHAHCPVLVVGEDSAQPQGRG